MPTLTGYGAPQRPHRPQHKPQPEQPNPSLLTALTSQSQPERPLLRGNQLCEELGGGSRNRWGDYSGIAVDPADPRNIWMYAEYAASPDNTWGTWFGQVTFPGFIPPALIFPGNGRLLNSTIPFFFWQASSEAVADYRLQVTSGDVVNGPFDIDVVIAYPTSRYQVTSGEALNDGTYKWRVTVRDAGAVNTSDSETRTLTRDHCTS